jgi:hypothetical protein
MLPIVAVILGALPGARAQAQEVEQLRRVAIITTISEAALATASLISERSDDTFESFGFTAIFSDREWALTGEGAVAGQKVGLTIAGYLWGEPETDWTVNYSGLGAVGDESLFVHGQSKWIHDLELKDYREMDFTHYARFGNNTIWGWVLGAELIVGGAIGAGGGLVAGPAGSLGGAILVGSAAVGISVGAQVLLEAEDPVEPPPMPQRPSTPQEGDAIGEQEGLILTVVDPAGIVRGRGLRGVELEGSFSEGRLNGSIKMQSK